MSVLHVKLMRELYRSKGLLLLISSIIAVGVTCFVAMQSAYYNLNEAKLGYYRQCRMADFWIDLKKAPLSVFSALRDTPGVTQLESRIQFQAPVDLSDFIEPVNGLVVSLPDRYRSTINGILIRQGDYFTDQRRNEVVISEKFARTHNLYPGSSVHLLLNNRRQELVVVGTAIGSEFTYLVGPGSVVPDPVHFGVFYVKRSFAEEVFDYEGAANQVTGRLAPDARDRVDQVMRTLERKLDAFGVFATTPLERQISNQFLSGEIDGLGAIATVIPAIFLAVAALVLNVLIHRMTRRQRVVVGTLKAMGYTDRQIFLHFLGYGMSVGAVGGMLGSLLGYLSSAGMTQVYRHYFEFPDLQSGFYPHTHAVGISVSLLCAVLGSVHGARTMLRLTPAESMRPAPPRRGGAILLESLLGEAWNQFSSLWRIALRSIFRNRFRTGTSLFAAMMGAGLLVTGFMMTEAQNFLVDFQFYREVRSDIDLAFKQERGQRAITELRDLPGVDHAEPLLQVACTFVHGPYRRKSGVTGLLSGARLTVPRNRDGHPVRIPQSGLLLTRRLAEILHVDAGARVTVIPIKGERRPVEVVVTEIADSYMGLAAYADIQFLSRLVGESLVITGAQLLTDRNPAHLRQLYRELKRLPGMQSIQSRRDMIDNLTETLLLNQFVFIGVLVLFSAVIFLGSIVNASMVSLAERQREVATFLALGYSHWEVGGMFLRESLLVNLAGSLLGLPAGYGLTWLTSMSYDTDIIRLPVVTASWVWVTTVSLAIVFALLAHGVVQWSIVRLDCLEALKVKE